MRTSESFAVDGDGDFLGGTYRIKSACRTDADRTTSRPGGEVDVDCTNIGKEILRRILERKNRGKIARAGRDVQERKRSTVQLEAAGDHRTRAGRDNIAVNARRALGRIFEPCVGGERHVTLHVTVGAHRHRKRRLAEERLAATRHLVGYGLLVLSAPRTRATGEVRRLDAELVPALRERDGVESDTVSIFE